MAETKTELTLETADRDLPNKGELGGGILMTPPINEDYWFWRVRLGDGQAIVGFPKFGTIGIAFTQEEDWNTNLPFACSAKQIFGHIEHNKGDDAISDEDCLVAIEMVREAARRFKGLSDDDWAAKQERVA